jgi:hypothetical protein
LRELGEATPATGNEHGDKRLPRLLFEIEFTAGKEDDEGNSPALSSETVDATDWVEEELRFPVAEFKVALPAEKEDGDGNVPRLVSEIVVPAVWVEEEFRFPVVESETAPAAGRELDLGKMAAEDVSNPPLEPAMANHGRNNKQYAPASRSNRQ